MLSSEVGSPTQISLALPLSTIKETFRNLPENGEVRIPAHIGLPFFNSSSVELTVSKLSVLARAFRSGSAEYCAMETWNVKDLKSVVGGMILGIEIVSRRNEGRVEAEVNNTAGNVRPLESFEYFGHLPAEIRRRIWMMALSWEEIIPVVPDFIKHYAHEQWYPTGLRTEKVTRKTALIDAVCWEAQRIATPVLKRLDFRFLAHCYFNPATDIFWLRNVSSGLITQVSRYFVNHERVAMPAKYWLQNGISHFHSEFSKLRRCALSEIVLVIGEEYLRDRIFTVDKFDEEKFFTPTDIINRRDDEIPEDDLFAFDKSATWDDIATDLKRRLMEEVEERCRRRSKLLEEGISENDLNSRYDTEDFSIYAIPEFRFRGFASLFS